MNITELKTKIAQRCRLVSGEDMDGNLIEDVPMIEFNTISEIITGELLDEITTFKEKCIKIANENWSKSQVWMLECLFETIEKECEYKCLRCSYFGRPGDAPETSPEDCMWEPNEDEEYRPCEDD